MKYWLTEIRLFFVIFKVVNSSIILSDASTSSTTKHDVSDKDILCYGHALSALLDNIYKIFCHTKIDIELWETLELKYGFVEKGIFRYSYEKKLNF